MIKKIGFLISLLVILLVAGAFYYYVRNTNNNESISQPNNQQTESNQPSMLSEVPSSLPQDLLPEPIAPILIQTRKLNKTTEEIKIEYVSLNAVSQVVKLYQQILTVKGWSVQVVSQDSMRAQLKVTKENQTGNFNLIQTPSSGTQVTLIYIHPIK